MHPDLVRVVERAIQITTQDIRVQEGLRTRERQAELALEQFNRDTRRLVLDQAWWRANPLAMLWPEMDAAFVIVG